MVIVHRCLEFFWAIGYIPLTGFATTNLTPPCDWKKVEFAMTPTRRWIRISD